MFNLRSHKFLDLLKKVTALNVEKKIFFLIYFIFVNI